MDIFRNIDRKLVICSIFITSIGIISTICSIYNISINKKDLLLLLVLLLLVFVSLYIYKLKSQNIVFKDLAHTLTLDEDGNEVELVKTKKFKVIKKNITMLYDSNICSSNLYGTAERRFVESKISGSSSQLLNMVILPEGGTYTLLSTSKCPLVRNKELVHYIKIIFINSFIEERENFTFNIDKKYTGIAKVTIHFPSSRPCKEAHVFCHLANGYEIRDIGAIDLQNPEIIEYTVTNPQYGTRYVIDWKW